MNINWYGSLGSVKEIQLYICMQCTAIFPAVKIDNLTAGEKW